MTIQNNTNSIYARLTFPVGLSDGGNFLTMRTNENFSLNRK